MPNVTPKIVCLVYFAFVYFLLWQKAELAKQNQGTTFNNAPFE